jgi:hypothetical protein
MRRMKVKIDPLLLGSQNLRSLNRVAKLGHQKQIMPARNGGVDLDSRSTCQVGASSGTGVGSIALPLQGLKTATTGEELPEQVVKPRLSTGARPTEWIESRGGRYEALLRALRAISAYSEPAGLFRALAGELQDVLRFDYLGLVLYDESRNKIEMPVFEIVNGPGVTIPTDLPAEDTLTWWVYHNQKPVVISHPSEEPRFPRIMQIYKRWGV